MAARPLIVAIDGPSGVGKSTTSRRVASVLGIPHIDTGAMYRAIALKAKRAGVPLSETERLAQLAAGSTIEFEGEIGRQRVLLDGVDVSDSIRTPEISLAASAVSAVSAVRRVLVHLQQDIGHRVGGVLEGRDIGTVVFPETPNKFFLTARPQVRAQRRFLELTEKGSDASFDAVFEEMERRDAQDSTRADSPLRCDESYILIDTSDLSIDEVVARIVAAVRAGSDAIP
ncbi:MAG: (d)CMP kinase [Thermoanaerobaculia bacterium]